jgi:Ion channel
VIQRWRYAVQASDSYGLVLFLLAVSFTTAALPGLPHEFHVLRLTLLGITMLFALRTSRAPNSLILTARILFGISFVIALIATITGGGAHARTEIGIIAALQFMLLALAPPAIVYRILRHPKVDIDTILGAVTVYVILGVFFEAIYVTISAFSTEPFFTASQQVEPLSDLHNFQFFSFVTLTTVGYGNLIPRSTLGQSLAILEALAGQIYLVTLVARLVSVFGTDRESRDVRRLIRAQEIAEETGGTRTANQEPKTSPPFQDKEE